MYTFGYTFSLCKNMYFTLNHVQNMFESQLWIWKTVKWTILGPKANGNQQVTAKKFIYTKDHILGLTSELLWKQKGTGYFASLIQDL